MFCIYVLLVLKRWYAGNDEDAVDDVSLPGSAMKLARTGMVGEKVYFLSSSTFADRLCERRGKSEC